MYVFTLLLSIIFIFFILYKLKLNLWSHVILWGTVAILTLIFYIVPFIMAVTGNIDLITLEGKTIDNSLLKYTTLLYVNIFMLCLIFGYFFLFNRFKKGERNECLYDISTAIDIISLLGLILICYSFNFSILQATKINRLEFLYDSFFSIRTLGEYLSYGVFASVYLIVRNKKIRFLPIISSILFLYIYLFVFRSRIQAVGLVLAGLMGFLSRFRKPRVNIGVIIAILLLVFFGVSWQYVRWHLHQTDSLSSLFLVLITAVKQGLYFSVTNGELGYLYKANQFAFYLVPNYYDYLYGSTLLRLLLLPFPSSIFAFKPVETQLIFSKMLGVVIPGASRPATIIGDIYMNFGFPGILVGTNLGLVLAVIQLLFNKYDSYPIGIVIGAFFPYCLVILLRGSLNGFPILLCWALLIFSFKFVSFLFNKKSIDRKGIIS